MGNLPFSSSYRATGDPAEVVTLAASDIHPGIVPCNELAEALEPDLDREADGTGQPFPVWAVTVP
ncbi:hypothetical protein V6U90_04245 [Micromonospora sp. CPCC 206060]|uniref:hypothetical protein n=1 Tax=Micromonospora sp. CPCC 206060 TaxID=3122406 RepID=UPI002FEF92A3